VSVRPGERDFVAQCYKPGSPARARSAPVAPGTLHSVTKKDLAATDGEAVRR
jgi:hypothetical protein